MSSSEKLPLTIPWVSFYRWSRMNISRLSSRFGRPDTWGNFQGNSRPWSCHYAWGRQVKGYPESKIASKARLEGVRIWVCIWYSLWFRHCSQPMCPSHLGLSTTIDPPIVTRSPGFNRFGFGGPTPSVWYLWLGGREVLPIRTLTNASKHLPHD